MLGIPAALLLAATGVGGTEEAATIAELEADDLVAMAAGMVRIADRDRRWLRDRLVELRELLVLRRAGQRRKASRER